MSRVKHVARLSYLLFWARQATRAPASSKRNGSTPTRASIFARTALLDLADAWSLLTVLSPKSALPPAHDCLILLPDDAARMLSSKACSSILTHEALPLCLGPLPLSALYAADVTSEPCGQCLTTFYALMGLKAGLLCRPRLCSCTSCLRLSVPRRPVTCMVIPSCLVTDCGFSGACRAQLSLVLGPVLPVQHQLPEGCGLCWQWRLLALSCL